MTASLYAVLSATCTTGFATWIDAIHLATALACLAVAVFVVLRGHSSGRLTADTLMIAAPLLLLASVWLAIHLGITRHGFDIEALGSALFALIVLWLVLRRLMGLTLMAAGANLCAVVLANALVGLALQGRGHAGPVFAALPLLMLYCLAATLILRARLGMHSDRSLRGVAAAHSDSRHFAQLKIGYAFIQAGILFALGLVMQAYGAAFCQGAGSLLHVVWHGLALGAMTTVSLACQQYLPAPAEAAAPSSAYPLPDLS